MSTPVTLPVDTRPLIDAAIDEAINRLKKYSSDGDRLCYDLAGQINEKNAEIKGLQEAVLALQSDLATAQGQEKP